jgi:hypothetical protein
MLWIVACNIALVALSAYGIYKERAFASSFGAGLVPVSLWRRLLEDLPERVLDVALVVGVVAELCSWRSAVIVNSLAYVAVAVFAIWGIIDNYGERPYFGEQVFYNALLVGGVQVLISILILWSYRKDWRRFVPPNR